MPAISTSSHASDGGPPDLPVRPRRSPRAAENQLARDGRHVRRRRLAPRTQLTTFRPADMQEAPRAWWANPQVMDVGGSTHSRTLLIHLYPRSRRPAWSLSVHPAKQGTARHLRTAPGSDNADRPASQEGPLDRHGGQVREHGHSQDRTASMTTKVLITSPSDTPGQPSQAICVRTKFSLR